MLFIYNDKQFVLTLCAFSSTSAPLIKIPFRASTPVPIITAVGVAKPKAQGHVIANTVSAHLNAYWNSTSV